MRSAAATLRSSSASRAREMAVVLGLGCIAAPGYGPAALAAGAGVGGAGPRRVEDFDPTDYLELRGLRPLARASQLACVAASAALGAPKALPAVAERCAVVVGTRFASIEPLVEFDRVAATDGPALVNPSSFPNVVANAHGGYLGILFGLAGPNVTLCGAEAGLEALALGLDLLELGRAEAVLAGGVEALGETLLEGLRRTGVEAPGEGSAFILLGRDGPGVGVILERAGAEPASGKTWSSADVVEIVGDCGAATGALAAVLAIEAVAAGAGPQLVGDGPDALLARPAGRGATNRRG
jgi:3-oxoacyl-[acyl-carrier-protein] synthase II